MKIFNKGKMSNNESDWMQQQREQREREEVTGSWQEQQADAVQETYWHVARLVRRLAQLEALSANHLPAAKHIIFKDFEICWDDDGVQINKFKK